MERNPSGHDRSTENPRGSDATPRTDNQADKKPSNPTPRRDHDGGRSAPDAHDAPAGNAVYDAREQTTRADMPVDEQPSEGQVRRGTQPAGGTEPSPRVPLAPEDGERRGDSNRP